MFEQSTSSSAPAKNEPSPPEAATRSSKRKFSTIEDDPLKTPVQPKTPAQPKTPVQAARQANREAKRVRKTKNAENKNKTTNPPPTPERQNSDSESQTSSDNDDILNAPLNRMTKSEAGLKTPQKKKTLERVRAKHDGGRMNKRRKTRRGSEETQGEE